MSTNILSIQDLIGKTIPVRYQKDGIFEALVDLPIAPKSEFAVQIIPDVPNNKTKSNAIAVLTALKAAKGVFSKNQSGLKYTRKIRKSWDNRLSKLYGSK